MEVTAEELFTLVGELTIENRQLKKVNRELAEALESIMGALPEEEETNEPD